MQIGASLWTPAILHINTAVTDDKFIKLNWPLIINGINFIHTSDQVIDLTTLSPKQERLLI